MLKRWLKNVLALAILAALIWYLVAHWDRLADLAGLGVEHLVQIYLVTWLATIVSAEVLRRMLRVLSARTPFWDMVVLQNATYLLNYLPMKAGGVFRANYLKRQYGLSYARFGALFIYRLLLIAMTASGVGLAALVAFYGLGGREHVILALGFAALLVGAALLIVLPLPVPKGKGRIRRVLASFLTGRRELSRSWRTLGLCAALLVVNSALSAAHIGIVYHSMGMDLHPAGYVILGALANVAAFLSFTPGAIGLRELLLGAGAVVIGISPEVGLFAAVIDGAICLSWSFAVGGPCAIWLWRKYPSDFKEAAKNDAEPAHEGADAAEPGEAAN